MELIIKLDHDEPVNTKVEKQHPEDELHPMDEVIQDLKLENNRLKQREEIMLHFITSCACRYPCSACDIKNKEGRCHYLKSSDSSSTGSRMTKTARDLLDRLEDL